MRLKGCLGPNSNSVLIVPTSESCYQGLHRRHFASYFPDLHIGILTRKLLKLVAHCSIQKCCWIRFGWSFGQPPHQIRLNLVSSANKSFKLLEQLPLLQFLHFVQTDSLCFATTSPNLQMFPLRCYYSEQLPTQMYLPQITTECFDSKKCPTQIEMIVRLGSLGSQKYLSFIIGPF